VETVFFLFCDLVSFNYQLVISLKGCALNNVGRQFKTKSNLILPQDTFLIFLQLFSFLWFSSIRNVNDGHWSPLA
jgi:hypothetical protein